MESAFSLNVPLAVDIGLGDNWYEAHWFFINCSFADFIYYCRFAGQ
jgi:hypothetical protein